MNICQVYVPIADKPAHDVTIIMGDIRAKVGEEEVAQVVMK